MTGSFLIISNAITAYLADASAGFLNVLMMEKGQETASISRDDTSYQGIFIKKSKNTARPSALQSAITRTFMCLPMIGLAFTLYGLELLKLMPKSFFWGSLVKVAILSIALTIEMPLFNSIF